MNKSPIFLTKYPQLPFRESRTSHLLFQNPLQSSHMHLHCMLCNTLLSVLTGAKVKQSKPIVLYSTLVDKTKTKSKYSNSTAVLNSSTIVQKSILLELYCTLVCCSSAIIHLSIALKLYTVQYYSLQYKYYSRAYLNTIVFSANTIVQLRISLTLYTVKYCTIVLQNIVGPATPPSYPTSNCSCMVW